MSVTPGGPPVSPPLAQAGGDPSSPSPASSDPSLLFLLEMFPRIHRAELGSILAHNGGNIDAAVHACLELEARHEAAAVVGAEDPAAASAPAAEARISLEPAWEGEEESEEQREEEEEEERKGIEEEDDDDVTEVQRPARPPSPLRSSISSLHALLTSTPAVSASAYVTSLRTLLHCVDNLLLHPRVEKYRLLPYSHAKFRAKVGGGAEGAVDERLVQRAKELLLRVGFCDVAAGVQEGFLLMAEEDRQEARLQHAKALLEQEIQEVQPFVGAMSPPPMSASAPSSRVAASSQPTVSARGLPVAMPVAAPVASAAAAPSLSSALYTPLAKLKNQYKRKETRPAAPMPTQKLSREQMAERVAARLDGRPLPDSAGPSGSGGVRAGRIMSLSHTAALRDRINAARRQKHSKWVASPSAQARQRVFTVADLAAMEEADIKARANFGAGAGAGGAAPTASAAGGSGRKFRSLSDFAVGNPADCLAMGHKMLALTNEFRAREGKRPLQWHQALHDIAMPHSKRMALGQVPLGHDGAKARFAAYPFRAHSAAENVAYSHGIADVPFCHVDGWINSPGHRKNMLANHNWCAIAVYRNAEGAYYSTQLFGLGTPTPWCAPPSCRPCTVWFQFHVTDAFERAEKLLGTYHARTMKSNANDATALPAVRQEERGAGEGLSRAGRAVGVAEAGREHGRPACGDGGCGGRRFCAQAYISGRHTMNENIYFCVCCDASKCTLCEGRMRATGQREKEKDEGKM